MSHARGEVVNMNANHGKHPMLKVDVDAWVILALFPAL
jgi:hypothetical protein